MAKEKTANSIKDQAVDAALVLAQARAWNLITLSDIAIKSKIPLADFYDYFEDRSDILVMYGRRIDKQVLEAFPVFDVQENPRDRLFDILMERFDVLNENRAALLSILSSFKLDPKQAVISLPHLCRSMTWMLEASDISTSGIKGAIRVAGLTGVYLRVLKVWMRDDTPDMAGTMAALDKSLGKVDRFASLLGL